MFWTEYRFQSRNPNQFESAGSIEIHTDGVNTKKPAWLVATKMLALVAMFIAGFAMVMPSIPLPFLPAATLTGGALLVYVGLAYFVRPEPNTDNMGWLGGTMDDRYQYNDDINRILWSLHCALGPGRFVSQTIVDFCTLCGMIAETPPADLSDQSSGANPAVDLQRKREQEIEARIEKKRREQPYLGEQALDSAKYLNS
jgi:hypothetical protein